MLDKKVVKLLNEQVNAEFYSAYLRYLDFANYFGEKGLVDMKTGSSCRHRKRDHAMLFIQYLKNNGEKVVCDAIQKPDVVVKKDMDVLKGSSSMKNWLPASSTRSMKRLPKQRISEPLSSRMVHYRTG